MKKCRNKQLQRDVFADRLKCPFIEISKNWSFKRNAQIYVEAFCGVSFSIAMPYLCIGPIHNTFYVDYDIFVFQRRQPIGLK